MQNSIVTPRLLDSPVISTSEKRLRRLLAGEYARFHFLTDFERALKDAEQAALKASGSSIKVVHATKTIMAASLGCDLFRNIQALALRVDEDLESVELTERQAEQSDLLWAFISEKSQALGLTPPESIASVCAEFIETWQPTACTYDELAETILRASNAKRDGQLIDWFNRLFPQLETACWGEELLPKTVVYEAVALLKVADEACLSESIWNSHFWLEMRFNLGVAAVRLANTEALSKTSRAVKVLEMLWESGDMYAGVQLAQMYHHLLPPKRLCLQRAESIIDKVMIQYQSHLCPLSIPYLRDTHVEFFVTYNETKIDVIRNAQDPDRVFYLAKGFIETLVYACQIGLGEFAHCAKAILRPEQPELKNRDFEALVEVRKKISQYPAAEAYCRRMAERLAGLWTTTRG